MEADGGQRERLGMHDGEALSLCPSFNSYSGVFAQIAAKVTKESELSTDETPPLETSNDLVDDADDFEFAFVRSDEILRGDQFHQIFPVFNRNVLIRSDQDNDDKPDVSNLRISLKNLFVEEREERDPLSSSSSSSEVDELEGVPSGSYCVWRPNLVEASPSRCKKSNSTGSASKRWRIRDLLRRSNSEGKDSQSLVLLTPKNKEREHVKIGSPKERRNSGDAVMVKVSSPSAHEVFYVRNRAWKEGDKRKSYLPYRQDLVGFFAKMKGVERTFPPY